MIKYSLVEIHPKKSQSKNPDPTSENIGEATPRSSFPTPTYAITKMCSNDEKGLARPAMVEDFWRMLTVNSLEMGRTGIASPPKMGITTILHGCCGYVLSNQKQLGIGNGVNQQRRVMVGTLIS